MSGNPAVAIWNHLRDDADGPAYSLSTARRALDAATGCSTAYLPVLMRESPVVACADRVERGHLRPLAAFRVVGGGIRSRQHPLRRQAGRR
jgi:hypothetical protein